MEDIKKIKKQTYELRQYAEAMIEDLKEKINSELGHKDLEVNKKNNEINQLKNKLEKIDGAINALSEICKEV